MALVHAPSFLSPSHFDIPPITVSFHSSFLPALPTLRTIPSKSNNNIHPHFNVVEVELPRFVIISSSSPPHKLARDPRLDKHVLNQNKIRFVQKLKTLLLSKPKHFMPLHILHKYCRSYLSLPNPRSVLSMINRYPTIFELFTIPMPRTPFHAAGPLTQLCVRLTPAAAALAKRETDLKKRMNVSLAEKLEKLLMLASPYHRLFLSKLAHLGPDLGLPVNFRSRLCNEHPDKFKVVDTSYGRALQLVAWNPNLAAVLPSRNEVESLGLIVDRPLKFKHLRLRKGLNIKRPHHDYLIKFREVPDVCPYKTKVEDFAKESIEAEKRACAAVREVLDMTLEKRTLVDHLTHFRKEFGLPNKLRGMLVRHPEMFYVSLKGQRDSVFLVESYNDKGSLIEKDELLVIKDELMRLVRAGKRMRREERNQNFYGNFSNYDLPQSLDTKVDDEYFDDSEDGLDDLFQLEDCNYEDEMDGDGSDKELMAWEEKQDFWLAETSSLVENQDDCGSGPW